MQPCYTPYSATFKMLCCVFTTSSRGSSCAAVLWPGVAFCSECMAVFGPLCSDVTHMQSALLPAPQHIVGLCGTVQGAGAGLLLKRPGGASVLASCPQVRISARSAVWFVWETTSQVHAPGQEEACVCSSAQCGRVQVTVVTDMGFHCSCASHASGGHRALLSSALEGRE